MAKILNQSQAKAVADAMCALNNVDGKVLISFKKNDDFIHVSETPYETIEVYYGDIDGNYQGGECEHYDSQAEFMKEYGV